MAGARRPGRRVAVLGGNPLGPIRGPNSCCAVRRGFTHSSSAPRSTSARLEPIWAGAAFSSNGTELAVDTEQGIVVWDLDPDHWVDAACDVAGRNLTHAEWDQYIGDLAPYRATCPQFTIT